MNNNSIEHTKASDFVQKKYNSSIVLFSHAKNSTYGRHFEVSYLKNDKKTFSNAYLRWVDGEKLFTEDEWQGIAYSINFDEVLLPKNPEELLINFLIN